MLLLLQRQILWINMRGIVAGFALEIVEGVARHAFQLPIDVDEIQVKNRIFALADAIDDLILQIALPYTVCAVCPCVPDGMCGLRCAF